MAVLNAISQKAKEASAALARRFGKKDAKRISPAAFRRGESGSTNAGMTEPGTTAFPRPIGKGNLNRRKEKQAKAARKLASKRDMMNRKRNSASRL